MARDTERWKRRADGSRLLPHVGILGTRAATSWLLSSARHSKSDSLGKHAGEDIRLQLANLHTRYMRSQRAQHDSECNDIRPSSHTLWWAFVSQLCRSSCEGIMASHIDSPQQDCQHACCKWSVRTWTSMEACALTRSCSSSARATASSLSIFCTHKSMGQRCSAVGFRTNPDRK